MMSKPMPGRNTTPNGYGSRFVEIELTDLTVQAWLDDFQVEPCGALTIIGPNGKKTAVFAADRWRGMWAISVLDGRRVIVETESAAPDRRPDWLDRATIVPTAVRGDSTRE